MERATVWPFISQLDDLFSNWVWRLLIRPGVRLAWQTAAAHWHLYDQMPKVNRAYNKVRNELCEVGLLYNPENGEDGYLDQIELEVAWFPSMGEAGYVFEDHHWCLWLFGFRKGVIYLPCDLPHEVFVPGATLTDVVRHEYAHCWHWLEPEFFETGWFERAFGGAYNEGSFSPLDVWVERNERDRMYISKLRACRNERERAALLRRRFRNEFVSEYAATHFCEDFAETFMTYLRYRNCLNKFQSRKRVFAKLKAVERAVAKARRELGL